VRISTPGHSTSGADGVGECGWLTPGVAPEKKLANQLTNEGELSDDPTLEASEQPDNIAALTISAAARRGPRRAKSKRSCQIKCADLPVNDAASSTACPLACPTQATPVTNPENNLFIQIRPCKAGRAALRGPLPPALSEACRRCAASSAARILRRHDCRSVKLEVSPQHKIKCIQRLVLTALRSEPVAEPQELHLVDRRQDRNHRRLDDLIFQCSVPTLTQKLLLANAPPFTHPGRLPSTQAILAQSWTPPDPLPTLGQRVPNLGAAQVDNPPFSDEGSTAEIQATIAKSWEPPDPLPTLTVKAIPIGIEVDNPPFTDFDRSALIQQQVNVSWQPPEPLPTIPRRLLAGLSVDALPRHPSRAPLYTAIAYWPWIPPDPQPTLNTKLAPANAAVQVNNPPFENRGRNHQLGVVLSWQPGPPQPFLPLKGEFGAEGVPVPLPAGGGKRRIAGHPDYVPEDFGKKKREQPIWDRKAKANARPAVAPDHSSDQPEASPTPAPATEPTIDPADFGRPATKQELFAEFGRTAGEEPPRKKKPKPKLEAPKPKPKPQKVKPPPEEIAARVLTTFQGLEPPQDPAEFGSEPQPEPPTPHEQDLADALDVLKALGMVSDEDEARLTDETLKKKNV
jgi:hypothetical protein